MATNKSNPFKGKTFQDLILYQDDDFLIINKPPYISTLEDRSSPINILQLAREKYPTAQVGHRLDKETSGVMVLTKNEDTYKYFSKLLEKREVAKLYHAIVSGRHQIDELEIKKPIFTSSNKSRIDFQEGKPSTTFVKSLEIYKIHTLLACMPVTGRMHQIRIHLADQRMPICCDEIYGGSPLMLSEVKKGYNLRKDEEEKPMIDRVALHAYSIQFPKPDGELLKISADYPKDFAVCIHQLKKNSH
jgi:23S rRNA pseudouridine955/2504/2580 synthase